MSDGSQIATLSAAATSYSDWTATPGVHTYAVTAVDIAGNVGATAATVASGKAEQVSPSCPGASRIGGVQTISGTGANPLRLPGDAYLAGPYEGAPLSLAIIPPAILFLALQREFISGLTSGAVKQ